ncbi:MAG TPA: hypothetical protein VM687_16990 [Stenotrophomonas sp.]|nr:hypothetical protein [Stenotrophomonas sp.]
MSTLRIAPPALLALAVLLALSACEREAAPQAGAAANAEPAQPAVSTATPNPTAPNFTWPASLQPFGEGYPNPGDPCRRLGESPAVADFLDHTQVLVGCPGRADDVPAATVIADGQGKPLALIDGVTVIAVPPNAAM